MKLKICFLQSVFFILTLFDIKAYSEKQSSNLREKVRSLKVCTTGGFVPFSSYSNGAWIGFDIEMIQEFSKINHFKYRIYNFNIDDIFQALKENKCDLIAAGITITDERKKDFLFSFPYYTSGIVYLYSKGNSEIDRLEKFEMLNSAKFKVGVKLGTTNDYFAVKYLGNANITKYTDYTEILNAVKIGAVDYVIVDLSFAAFIEKKNPNQFLFKLTPEDHEMYGIAARKNNKDLINSFNLFLDKWKNSGKYEKTLKKYFN
ncbi:ABC transporter substrate-binding protein [Pigmentibacter sp. JX0631]|uniref:substrate-binding periplasmic protein n=1 Tax=Pigmentibacter sp. JX0631 TaxID=2976982 RepID=UPI002468F764|nr:ABC transporter substrate-binding protein [Pigmentibacter sp. JX0631]WGL59060.1 ABC transporter substrate-binding protein [Pigmentibacter sp. JX0631]